MSTLSTTSGTIERKRPSLWRTVPFTLLAGLFALASMFILEGLTEGLMPWVIIGCPGCGVPEHLPTVTLHRWHGAEHGALLGLLFGGSLIGLLWRAHTKPLLMQFYALGHLLLPLGYGLLGPVYNDTGTVIGFVAIMLVTTGLLLAAYPAPRELLRFGPARGWSRPLLVLTAIAAALLVPVAVRNLLWQINGVGGESMIHGRWTGGALTIVHLLLAGLLAATRRPGWGALGILVGATYVYLGAAALTVPGQPGSWGLIGGALAMLCGGAYIVAVVREGRAAKG